MRQPKQPQYSAILLPAVILCLAITSLAAASQSQNGTIEGLVTTGGAAPTPLDRVTVKVSRTGDRYSAETTTDGAGHFIVRDVPPGRYVVQVERDGYGYRLAPYVLSPTRSLPITVASASRTEVPPIELAAAGTIRGRVYDRDGNAVSGTGVEFLHLTNDEDGRRIWQLVSTAVITSDDGQYERNMLAPGDYYVRTVLETGPLRMAVYYPETTEGSLAAPIAISEGKQATVDLRIAPRTLAQRYRVSGKVIRLVSEAAKSALIELLLLKNDPSEPTDGLFRPLLKTSLLNSETFELQGIPPGRYDLIATGNIDGSHYWSKVAIDARDRDVENADLTLWPTTEILGQVTVEGALPNLRVLGRSSDAASNQVRPQLGDIKLAFSRMDGLPLGVGGRDRPLIGGDGRTFSIRDVPEGDYQLTATIEDNGYPPGPPYYISDIRAGGRSVLATGFHVGVDPVDSLEVVIGAEGASIQGRIQGSNSPVVAALILVPEFSLREVPSLYRVIYVPRNAEFKMSGIAPGSYKLFAVPYLNTTIPYRSPQFIARYESRAANVTAQKGATVMGVQAPFLAR